MENNRPENIRGKSLDAMSTANLQELLEAELDSNQDIDLDKLDDILAALDARTEQNGVDVDSAWDRFFHNHLQSEPIIPMPDDTPAKKTSSRKKHLIRIGLIAAMISVFCIGVGVTASAVGNDVWDAVMQWSSETFGFAFAQNRDTSSIKQDPEYSVLKEALAKAGVTTALIPNYLPDGFRQKEFYKEEGGFVGIYQNGEQIIVIQVQEIESKNNTQLEKDQVSPEIYTVNGIDHFITTNMDDYLAVWISNGYECFISGVPRKSMLLKMIDSIYLEGYE